MKISILGILLFSIIIVGCKKETKPIPVQVVQPVQLTLNGQMFIVTKGRENIVLGDETVVLLDKSIMKQYCDSKAEEWKSNLLVLQSNIEAETMEYRALNKSNIIDYQSISSKFHL